MAEKKNRKKKKYTKPSVSSEKITETAALSCGKCSAGLPIWDFNCGILPMRS